MDKIDVGLLYFSISVTAVFAVGLPVYFLQREISDDIKTVLRRANPRVWYYLFRRGQHLLLFIALNIVMMYMLLLFSWQINTCVNILKIYWLPKLLNTYIIAVQIVIICWVLLYLRSLPTQPPIREELVNFIELELRSHLESSSSQDRDHDITMLLNQLHYLGVRSTSGSQKSLLLNTIARITPTLLSNTQNYNFVEHSVDTVRQTLLGGSSEGSNANFREGAKILGLIQRHIIHKPSDDNITLKLSVSQVLGELARMALEAKPASVAMVIIEIMVYDGPPLLEIGKLSLEKGESFFACMALDKLDDMAFDVGYPITSEKCQEEKAIYFLGLLAHFWCTGPDTAAQNHARAFLFGTNRVFSDKSTTLECLQIAREFFQFEPDFATADKLQKMHDDLQKMKM